MNVVDAATKASLCTVVLYLYDKHGRVDMGSGVLVAVGGRDFVLTAGHNLEDCRDKNDIRLFFPGWCISQASCGPSKEILSYDFRSEPDVGYVELDSSHRLLWQRRTPIPTRDLVCKADTTCLDRMVLLGFPSAAATVGQNLREGRQDLSVATSGICVAVTLADVRSPHDKGNRPALNVAYHGEFVDSLTGTPIVLPEPHGISGGPLCAVSETGVRLLGIARSVHGDQRHMWCEPIIEAVRLLCEHSDACVREEARAAVELLAR